MGYQRNSEQQPDGDGFEFLPGVSRRDFLRLLASGAALGTAVAWSPSLLWSAPADEEDADSTPLAKDEYWAQPQAAYEQRRLAMLKYCAASSPAGKNGCYTQIARLELGLPINEKAMRDTLDFIATPKDCTDFAVSGLLRMLYRYRNTGKIPAPLLSDVQTGLLKFKYWWDEPVVDKRCYHTENHQILNHANQLLAGELFPDAKFTSSGRMGHEQAAFALPMVRRWMDWRVQFGFSEWLSNCYFGHDLAALANLRDFAEQPDLRACAEMLIDVMLFEIAMHSHRGVAGSTHGRTYARMIKGGRGDHISPVCKLVFGMGVYNMPDNMAPLALATSSYRCPPAVLAVASDLDRTILSRERHSLNVEDAPHFGLAYDKEDDLLLFWGIQEYDNPLVIDESEKISKLRHVRNFEDYDKWRNQYKQQIAEHGHIINPWISRQALGEVHIQTQRTPAYMLSCAQDYRPGTNGYQQHIWQATLGVDAVVFTNHPGSKEAKARPDYWAGNDVLPRAAQHHNVLVCIHHIPADATLPYSHAYFPRAAFDEVIQRANWTFGRKGDGFIALFSQHPTQWHAEAGAPAGSVPVELSVAAADNIWICEMGSRTAKQDFAQFVQAVSAAPLRCDGLRVRYASPSIGELTFGWEGPLTVAGAEVPLHDSPRFDNPYCQSPFLSPQIEIRHAGSSLALDFSRNQRKLA